MGFVSMATAPHGSKPAEEIQGGESGVGLRSGGVGWGGVARLHGPGIILLPDPCVTHGPKGSSYKPPGPCTTIPVQFGSSFLTLGPCIGSVDQVRLCPQCTHISPVRRATILVQTSRFSLK